MAINDSIAKRRTVRMDKAASEQSAERSRDTFSLSGLPSHPTSPGFVTRLFWA